MRGKHIRVEWEAVAFPSLAEKQTTPQRLKTRIEFSGFPVYNTHRKGKRIMKSKPIIITERLTLHEMEQDDFPALCTMLQLSLIHISEPTRPY